jgi:hypothetical protein
MVRSIPEQLLDREPDATIVLYGQKEQPKIDHPNISYVDEVRKSYRLFPHFKLPDSIEKYLSHAAFDDEDLATHAPVEFSYATISRRRPWADIYLPGRSDIVIFKDSMALLMLPVIEKDIRDEIVNDCRRIVEEARATQPLDIDNIVFKNTEGAQIAGLLFEAAIQSGPGESYGIAPASAHYVQGVGEKFAQLRPRKA